jgi:hypothetical protein
VTDAFSSTSFLAARLAVLVTLLAALSACVSQPAEVGSTSGWNVRCNTDAVSRSTECFAGRFGSPMDYNGQPFNSPVYPLKVFFRDGRGPYMQVGWHNFPGEQPTIRFDDDRSPFTIPDDGGVSSVGVANAAVERLRSASIARARFWSWPNGAQEMYVDVSGFSEAYEELKLLVGR